MEDVFRAFDRNLPALSVGANAPAINVAETADAIEVTAELPGVEDKDIKVSLDGNQLTISGEKKEETKKDEKDWHIEERSYGSFYRSMSLPFSPGENAIEGNRSHPQAFQAAGFAGIMGSVRLARAAAMRLQA
jgi:HSP20 family protein